MEMAKDGKLERLIERTGGILKLRPTYVRRFYKDGGRLGLSKKPGGTFNPRTKLFVPERWIASCVEAHNPHPIKGEGLSKIWLPKDETQITLREALQKFGNLLLGEERNRAHNGEFRVLVKILDPAEPIVFHFHARDEDVWAHPEFFAGHRFGKDEAYFFLDAPKGSCPYTHLGLVQGVDETELLKAIEKGRDYLLELSPYYLQRIGEGYFTPSGVPHRPGTALCLEIQQPSDVYTLLETETDGRKMSPEQIHPGFPDLQTAIKFLDFKTAQDPDLLERCRLIPQPINETKQKGGQEWWIFPPTLTKKFSGKKLVVTGTFESVENDPYALLVWKGKGKLNGKPVKVGDEFFVGYIAATKPHKFECTSNEPLVVFKLFPQAVE
jgi:mannose-6-phosphate isomerase class I